jgi:hypothetical protein
MALGNLKNQKINMKSKIEIIIGSPIDYEELVAYVVIDDQHVCLLNQDAGKDKLKVEFFDEPKIKEIDYNTLIEALMMARETLLK